MAPTFAGKRLSSHRPRGRIVSLGGIRGSAVRFTDRSRCSRVAAQTFDLAFDLESRILSSFGSNGSFREPRYQVVSLARDLEELRQSPHAFQLRFRD